MKTELKLNGMRYSKQAAQRLTSVFALLRASARAGQAQALDMIGLLVAGEAKELIYKKSPSIGRRLRYSGTGKARVVYPARRGFPPNSDTGTLANSIHWHRQGINVYIGSTVKYSKYLENPEQLDRPFLAPAAEKNKVKIDNLLTQFMESAGVKATRSNWAWAPGKVSYAS